MLFASGMMVIIQLPGSDCIIPVPLFWHRRIISFGTIGQFSAVSMESNSREQIYSAMVVYGLLTYHNGKVLIPNKELMDRFNDLLLSKDSLGYVYQLAKKSEQMLQATIEGNVKVMEEILQFAHNTEAPILSYNSEVELAAVVNLCYLSARNRYRVERGNWVKNPNIQDEY